MKLFFKWLLKITEHPLIGGIALLVITALYGAITKKLGEWLGYIWIVITLAFDFVLSILTYEVAVWEIIVLLVVAVGTLILYVKWTAVKESTVEEEVEEEVEEATSGMITSNLENLILKLYISKYKSDFSVLTIGRKLGATGIEMLQLEQSLDILKNKGLLIAYYNTVSDTTFGLSAQGRDYILEHLAE